MVMCRCCRGWVGGAGLIVFGEEEEPDFFVEFFGDLEVHWFHVQLGKLLIKVKIN